ARSAGLSGIRARPVAVLAACDATFWSRGAGPAFVATLARILLIDVIARSCPGSAHIRLRAEDVASCVPISFSAQRIVNHERTAAFSAMFRFFSELWAHRRPRMSGAHSPRTPT